jgi:HJR/Mrr/RecB family endonuclease
LKKYYKKKNKNKKGITFLLFQLSVIVSGLVYLGTSSLKLSIFVLVLSICCFFGVLFWKLYSKREKLLKSGILAVDKMSGEDFEEFILEHFKVLGYSGYVTRGSQDYGADIVIQKNGIITVVQAKRWNQKVSVEAVQQVAAAVKHYKANKSLVITNNYFTKNAYELAKSNQTELWNRNKLIKVLIEKCQPIIPEPAEHEESICPICGSKLIKREGKHGNFLGCQSYPKCRFTKNIHQEKS